MHRLMARLPVVLTAAVLASCTEDSVSTARAYLTVSPGELDFGTRAAGSRAELKITLTNEGRAALTVTGAELRNDARGAFKPGAPPPQVEGGATYELVVTYEAPATEGQDAATLVLQSTADNAASLSIPLLGRTSAPRCDDRILNGQEANADCGGPECSGCKEGARCRDARDCEAKLGCSGKKCGACAGPADCRTGQICRDGVCEGCGADRDCADGSTCVQGLCAPCPGATGRIDTLTDANHCGACNNKCADPVHATAACVAGQCGRGPCDPGYFDIDGTRTFGCEARCTNRRCTDDAGTVTVVSNDPLPERGLVAGAFASGSSFGGQVQTNANWTNTGILGESTPLSPGAPEQQNTRWRHAGGLVSTQR